MDVIESVVRALIKEGKLSRARALLSVFQDEYPHLLFELEETAGNYEAALKIYEKLPEDVKKIYEQRAKKLKERLKREYRKDFRDAVAEIEKKNYEGALALLEGITKDYPELVEAVALKLEIARRRGDRAKAQSLEQLLEALDSTHPSLISKPQKKAPSFGAFEYVVIILSSVILALSLMVLFTVPTKAFIEERLKFEKPGKIDLTGIEKRITSETERVIEAVKGIEIPEVPKVDVQKIAEEVSKAVSKSLNEKISELEKAIKEVKPTVPSTTVASVDLKPLEAKIERLASIVEEMKKRVDGYFAPPILPGERVYKPSTKLDAAKVYWLAGYIMYLKKEYKSAVDLFVKSLRIIEENFPHVYFHDDCYYYLALSYYMMGDYENAKKHFENFIKEFPKSEYVDDAQMFLKEIGGERG